MNFLLLRLHRWKKYQMCLSLLQFQRGGRSEALLHVKSLARNFQVMINQLPENNEYCRLLERNGEKARLLTQLCHCFPAGIEGNRGSIQSPVKKYLPLSKACKKQLKVTRAGRISRKKFRSCTFARTSHIPYGCHCFCRYSCLQ